MAQFEQNVQLIAQYGEKWQEKNSLKGLFAVVSDPVDPFAKRHFWPAAKMNRANWITWDWLRSK